MQSRKQSHIQQFNAISRLYKVQSTFSAMLASEQLISLHIVNQQLQFQCQIKGCWGAKLRKYLSRAPYRGIAPGPHWRPLQPVGVSSEVQGRCPGRGPGRRSPPEDEAFLSIDAQILMF